MALIDVNWNPSKKELRVFALLQLVFFAVVSWLIHRRLDATTAAGILLAVSAAAGLLGLLGPPLLRPVYVVWMAAVLPIGWVVSHVLMAAVYYLIMTPIGLVMRLVGRDPMERKFDKSASSYWKPRPPQSDTKRYFQQF